MDQSFPHHCHSSSKCSTSAALTHSRSVRPGASQPLFICRIHPNTRVIKIKTRGRRTHTQHPPAVGHRADPRLCLRSEEDGRITLCVCRDISPDQGFKPSTSLKSSITHILHAAPPTHHPPPSPPLHLQLCYTCTCRISDITSCSEVNKEALHAIKTNRLKIIRKAFRFSRPERRRIKEYVYPKMKVQSSSFPPLHLLDNLNRQIQIIQC